MVSSTTEDYLKRIQVESEGTGLPVVSLGRLASLAGVTPGTVTSMVKGLADSGLLTYLPRRGVRLTAQGTAIANRVLRRHRLIELFLVDRLGFDWSEVHSEAEILEHAVSDRIVNRIDEMLGYPAADPHGDPISSANGEARLSTKGDVGEAAGITLSGADRDQRCTVVRITNDEPSFLTFLKKSGLVPGASVLVVGRDDDAGTIEVEVSGQSVTLSLSITGRILLTPA